MAANEDLSAQALEPKHIAFFMSSLTGGGAERSMLTVAKGFAARGHKVDLLLCHKRGDYPVPHGIRLIELSPKTPLQARLAILCADPRGIRALLKPVLLPLKSSTKLRFLRGLTQYLRTEKPQVLLSAMTNPNLVALWASRQSKVPVRVIISERNTLSSVICHKRHQWRWRYIPAVVNRVYARADEIIAVSNYVADDLVTTGCLPRERIATVYNPVVTRDLAELAARTPAHDWLMQPDVPIILAAGRLTPAKDFATLIKAFTAVRRRRAVRMLILGEGPQRAQLQTLINSLDVPTDVILAGWFENPFACMANASVFVLSSAWEGLPGVLIQAMACGCPVVSTDCPGGSREILEDGRYGPLVPVGDYQTMASAIVDVLDRPMPSGHLVSRAAVFSEQHAIDQYQEICLAK